jgi:hypothetical protein
MALPDLLERLKSDDTPCGVAAEFCGETGSPGRDAYEATFRVTDGRKWGYAKLRLTGTEGGRPGMNVSGQVWARALESKAGIFPWEDRLLQMIAMSEGDEGHIPIHADELATAEPRSALSRPLKRATPQQRAK